MDVAPPFAQVTIPWGGQEVALQEVVFGNGTPLLRVRIREGRRFTIFDIDARSALYWADAMRDWALRQPGAAGDERGG